MDRRIAGLILVCMLGLTPAYAANVCDPRDGTACEGANSSATGGGAHTSEYTTLAGLYSGQKAIYAIGQDLVTVAATTDPFFVICGSNTKTVYIQKFNINGAEGTTAARRAYILRQTLRPTGNAETTGPSTLVATPFDSAYGASTVDKLMLFTTVSTAFTRTPDFSVIVGTQTTTFPVNATPVVGETIPELEWDFVGSNYGRERAGLVLHGSTQCLEVAVATIGANALKVAFTMQWAEIQEK